MKSMFKSRTISIYRITTSKLICLSLKRPDSKWNSLGLWVVDVCLYTVVTHRRSVQIHVTTQGKHEDLVHSIFLNRLLPGEIL